MFEIWSQYAPHSEQPSPSCTPSMEAPQLSHVAASSISAMKPRLPLRHSAISREVILLKDSLTTPRELGPLGMRMGEFLGSCFEGLPMLVGAL